jgi:hypothetical protein
MEYQEKRWLSYNLNEENCWENLGWNYGKKDSPFPFPNIFDLEFHEGNKVYVIKNGIKTECVVQGIQIACHLWELEKGWFIYYDLKWAGTGHTHGFFQSKDILKD